MQEAVPVILALITLITFLATGFFKLVNEQVKVHGKIAKGLEGLTKSGDKQATAMREIARETKQGNKESAKRNGHLGEQNVQITQLIQETRKDMLNNLENIKEQHVDKQIVEHQEVQDPKE